MAIILSHVTCQAHTVLDLVLGSLLLTPFLHLFLFLLRPWVPLYLSLSLRAEWLVQVGVMGGAVRFGSLIHRFVVVFDFKARNCMVEFESLSGSGSP